MSDLGTSRFLVPRGSMRKHAARESAGPLRSQGSVSGGFARLIAEGLPSRHFGLRVGGA